MQAVTGQVQGQDRLATVQAQVHAQVGVELVDAGALAFGGAQLVDNGVLDLQGAEVSVIDTRTMAAEFYRQGAVGQQVVCPLDVMHAVVEVFGVLHGEALEHQQHAVAQARPQAQAIGRFHVGHAAHGGGVFAGVFEAKRGGFLSKQAFEAFGAGEKEFVTIRHGVSRGISHKWKGNASPFPSLTRRFSAEAPV